MGLGVCNFILLNFQSSIFEAVFIHAAQAETSPKKDTKAIFAKSPPNKKAIFEITALKFVCS
eukprot:3951713-Amphidinium_carterae.1